MATSVDRAGEARPYGADGILGRRVATHLGGVWRGALRGGGVEGRGPAPHRTSPAPPRFYDRPLALRRSARREPESGLLRTRSKRTDGALQ